MNNDDCPLHSESSIHAVIEEEEIDMVLDQLLRRAKAEQVIRTPGLRALSSPVEDPSDLAYT